MISTIEQWIAYLEEIREDGIEIIEYPVPELILWLRLFQQGRQSHDMGRYFN